MYEVNNREKTTDPKKVTVKKTNPPRGPLNEKWIQSAKETKIPVMCAYKIVRAKFEVWGFQSKVEAWTQKVKLIISRFYHIVLLG